MRPGVAIEQPHGCRCLKIARACSRMKLRIDPWPGKRKLAAFRRRHSDIGIDKAFHLSIARYIQRTKFNHVFARIRGEFQGHFFLFCNGYFARCASIDENFSIWRSIRRDVRLVWIRIVKPRKKPLLLVLFDPWNRIGIYF